MLKCSRCEIEFDESEGHSDEYGDFICESCMSGDDEAGISKCTSCGSDIDDVSNKGVCPSCGYRQG